MANKDRKVFNRYLTEAEDKKLFSHIWKFRAERLALRDYHWMQILRQTGMRINNLSLLTVDDALVVLNHPKNHLTLRDEDCKKGQGYTLKFNTQGCKSLRALLKLRKVQGFVEVRSDALIMSRQGHEGLSVRTFQSRMQQWVLSSGIGVEASPHWFRHTLAKRILARTEHHSPLQVVQHALGHSSLSSTEVYTRPDRDAIDTAMEIAS